MAAKKLTPADSVADLLSRTHKVEKGKPEKMVKAFEKSSKALAKAKKNGEQVPANTPDWPKCWTINGNAIKALLKRPGAIGIRFFPAMSEDGSVTLVMVAVDENGNNIILPPPAPKKAAKTRSAGDAAPSIELDENAYNEVQRYPPYPPGSTSFS